MAPSNSLRSASGKGGKLEITDSRIGAINPVLERLQCMVAVFMKAKQIDTYDVGIITERFA